MKFLVTCTAVLALTTMLSAQSDPSGAMPLEETGAQISADTSAQSQIQAFLDSKGWTEGENSGKNGPFIVTTGVGTIAAPPNHPSYAASRPRAFAKAMLAAKSNMSRYLSVSISTAVMSKYQEANNNTTPTPQEEMAAALAAMPPDSLIGKARAYTGAKLDNLLRKEGVSVDVQREAAQAAYAAAAEKAKQLAATEEFQRSVNSTSTALISGLQAFFTVEGFDPETKQGEIGVVAIWSPVLAETAASLTSASVPAAFKKGKKSIKEQIPTDTAILLSTFGVQQKIDENGNYVLVSYGQSAARTSNSRAKNAAYNKARLDADGQIRSFAGEAVVCSDALSEAEQSLDYNLEGQLPDYNDESSYNEYQQSVGKNLEINGITTIHRWTAVHPVSGQTVYGVVRMWSPVSGMKARQNKANIESPAKDGAAGRRSVAPVSPVTAQSGSAANTSTGSPMLNYGSQGDEDAF